ncbi:MAG: CBS domain-containing protein, partial [Bacteroidetes bacterium QH_2_63_10]
MAESEIGPIVVMAGDDIAGIFTERDYVREIAMKGRRSENAGARTAMTEDVVTVTPNPSPEDCLDLTRDVQ